MGTFGSGLSASIGYGLETTADVPVTPTQFIPLISESLGQDRGRVESAAIIKGRAILDSNMWNGGNIEVGGDVAHELYNKGLGKLFTGMYGTVASTTGPVNGLYTHTWTGINDPKPLTIQKGVPATTTTVYPITYSGSMVDSWEIKCSAGEIVTFGATFACAREIGYRTVTDGATNTNTSVTSVTAAFGPDDVGKPISGTGIPTSTTIASVQSATAATLSAAATATATGVTFTIGLALTAVSYPSSLKPFKYNHGSVTLGGTALKVKQFTLSGKTGLDTDRFFLGSRNRDAPLKADWTEITGSVDIEFRDRAQYDRYINEATHTLTIPFTNYAGESVTFNTTVRVDGETPKVGGRGIVGTSVPFKMTDTTDAGAFSVVVVSTDATP